MTTTGTLIWCARAAYFTRDSIGTIAAAIDGAIHGTVTPGTEGFIFVNQCHPITGEPTGQQVMLAIGYISSIVPKTYDPEGDLPARPRLPGRYR